MLANYETEIIGPAETHSVISDTDRQSSKGNAQHREALTMRLHPICYWNHCLSGLAIIPIYGHCLSSSLIGVHILTERFQSKSMLFTITSNPMW